MLGSTTSVESGTESEPLLVADDKNELDNTRPSSATRDTLVDSKSLSTTAKPRPQGPTGSSVPPVDVGGSGTLQAHKKRGSQKRTAGG
jgi:hypothetical protein